MYTHIAYTVWLKVSAKFGPGSSRRCAETEETNDFNWLDPAWSQQEVGDSTPWDAYGISYGHITRVVVKKSPGNAMVDHHLCGVVPRLESCSVDVRCKMERWRSRMWRRRMKTTVFLMSLYIFVDPYSRPYRPNCFAWHRKRLERQAISAVANHWQIHMAYHAGQRMRAQVIMMVFRMLGESLANYWLFMAIDSLALQHEQCIVPFRASHWSGSGRCFHWSAHVPAIGHRLLDFLFPNTSHSSIVLCFVAGFSMFAVCSVLLLLEGED